MNQVIQLRSGRPGAGKTQSMLKAIVEQPGRYLLACPRIDLIHERVADFRRHSAALGVSLIVEEAHSKTPGVETVARQLTDARNRHAATSHAVVVTTHQAVIEADLLDWHGWHMRLDEAPLGVKSHAWTSSVSTLLFEALYDLIPVEGHAGWHHITPKPACPGLGSFMRDDSIHANAIELHKAVMRPQGALTTLGSWSELVGSNRPFQWASIWTPYELRAFASCEIASAAYRNTLTHLATEHLYPNRIELRDSPVPSMAPSSAPVEIVYFTRHRGSTEFWDKHSVGRECLRMVRDYLAGQQLGYWATNQKFMADFAARITGRQVSPKTEGTNELRQHTSCAFIYSAKRQPADKLLQQLFPIMSNERIERARQIEDIIQFVFRGCIRTSGNATRYCVYLYDVFQAEALHQELTMMGYTATLVGCEEAGIMEVVREETRGRKADLRCQSEREAERREKARLRMSHQRQAQRALDQAKGAYKPVGRPKTSGMERRPPIIT